MTPQVLRELSRARTPVDRLRTRMTALAAAGTGVALLAAISIAVLRSTEPTGVTVGYTDPDGRQVVEQQLAAEGGLAPFLAQEGLRPGAVLAAVLLIVPFLALALQALRVGSLALDRHEALLALAGATPGDLRHVRMRRTAASFGLGALLAGPLYLLLWLLLGRALPAGWRLLPIPQAWLPLAWLAVAGLLTLAGAGIGARSRPQRADPLARARHAEPPPRVLVAWLSGLGAVAVLLFALRAASVSNSDVAEAAVLLLEALLLLVCASTVVALRAARTRGAPGRGDDNSSAASAGAGRSRTSRRVGAAPTANRRLFGSRGSHNAAVTVLAAAQRRGNPRAAGAVAGVLFICGLSFGVEAAFIASVLNQSDVVSAAPYVGGALLAAVVGAVGVLVALLALALSLTDHLLSARRSVASTAALGTEPGRLLAVQTRALSATAAPATASGTLLAGLLFALPTLGLSLPRFAATVASVLAVTVLSAGLVALACRLVAIMLAGRLRTAASLDNLRIP